ncbi:hypothetical protein [Marinimicrobium koreense]|nr:hypothetical protein [Marinimicrobium koreense]
MRCKRRLGTHSHAVASRAAALLFLGLAEWLFLGLADGFRDAVNDAFR